MTHSTYLGTLWIFWSVSFHSYSKSVWGLEVDRNLHEGDVR